MNKILSLIMATKLYTYRKQYIQQVKDLLKYSVCSNEEPLFKLD